ncbi:MAG TPA: DUF6328 family protein [Bradyrhizobium sp.]
MAIEDKLKTALDESRLLILGAQVLFGFQFEAVFQELFSGIPTASRYVHCAGLVLLLISVGLLIAPSLFHQIVFAGESRPGAVRIAGALAAASLLPLTLGLGAATFVTFEQLFNRSIGIAAGASFTAIALGLLYGLGFAFRQERKESMAQEHTSTPLKSRIEQMLTEARVIIPGAQALLGFQLIAVLTKAFTELPPVFKYIHVVGLSAVALSVTLLMTPAALHRIGFHGEDNPRFFQIGSLLVVAGSIPLAVGIASDVAVVFFKAVESAGIAMASGVASLAVLLGLWLGYPLLVAGRLKPSATRQRATG